MVRPSGPSATVYLAPVEAGDQEVDRALRSRAIAEHLSRSGAPAATVDTVLACVAATGGHRIPIAIGVTGLDILFSQQIAGWPGPDRCRYGAPAHVLPLLSWLQHHPPYVEVLIDRAAVTAKAGPTRR